MSKLKPCPKCGEPDEDELTIDSCGSLGLSEISCHSCGYTFQSHAYEENIHKHWNKLNRTTTPST